MVEQLSQPWLQHIFLSMTSYGARTSVLPSGLPAGKCPFTGGVTSQTLSSNGSYVPEIILSVMYLSHPSTELHTAPLCYLLSVTECLTCGWAGIGGFADDTKPQRFVLVFYVSACLHGVLFFAAHPTLLPKGH